MKKRRLTISICLLLAAVTMILYWPITGHDFLHYDDRQYIIENPHVNPGLTWSGIVWSFQCGYAANWHPLTWMSHMIDCSLYGLNPRGHHLTNLLIHAANTSLLFLLLKQTSGNVWRSFLVAAFFGWHPLHVESVAWAAERKDVLSGFFWILTMMAYVFYCKRPGGARYGLSLLLFALGLMSKPMLVTLPFVLLLMDFWPLCRYRITGAGTDRGDVAGRGNISSGFSVGMARKSAGWLVLEKFPFFALTLGASILTYLAQMRGETVRTWTELPLGGRVANGAISYIRYGVKIFWPTDLSVAYPYPQQWPSGTLLAAALLLGLLSVLFVWYATRAPYLVVGWLWFLGTLVPTIGLVQVGYQSMADRYTYVPAIGLAILVVWGVGDLLRPETWKRAVAFGLGGAALIGCLVSTRLQLKYWQDSETLFRRATQVAPDNYIAWNYLGYARMNQGRIKEGMADFLTALGLEPNSSWTHANLGVALLEQNRPVDAEKEFVEALRLKPVDGRVQYHLATALIRQHKSPAAILHYREALRLQPDDANVLNDLAWVLAADPSPTVRRGGEAIQLAERACKMTDGRQAEFLITLAAAYAETGRFSEAITTVQKAGQLAVADGQDDAVARAGRLQKLFESRQTVADALGSDPSRN